MDEHYRKLERMYAGAGINRYFAPGLHVSDGRAEVRMTVRPDFFHAAHAVHGAVYFKALDDAAFFAAQSAVTSAFVLTVTFNVVLLRPVTGGILVAHGTLTDRSRTLLVAESHLRDEDDRVIARGSGTFMTSRIALNPAVGYE